MKIGFVNILGADKILLQILKEQFHNTPQIVDPNNPIPEDLDLLIIPASQLYCENKTLKENISASNLYKNLANYGTKHKFIVGIQAGFDILCQAKLLPGYFDSTSSPLVNKQVYLHAEFKRTPLTYLMNFDKPIKLYLSHSLGSYTATPAELSVMRIKGQIVLKYCNENGQVNNEANPDNSIESIAAVCNERKTIFGITANPSTRRLFQTKFDGFEFMDSFFKMITR